MDVISGIKINTCQVDGFIPFLMMQKITTSKRCAAFKWPLGLAAQQAFTALAKHEAAEVFWYTVLQLLVPAASGFQALSTYLGILFNCSFSTVCGQ